MAQETIIKLIDDLDGSEATETVSFGLDGEDYQIDLSAKNAAALRKAVDRYRDAARSASSGRSGSAGPRRTRGKGSRGRGEIDPRVVRAWATEHGFEISSRGRIPSEVLEQYKASGNR